MSHLTVYYLLQYTNTSSRNAT